MTEPVLQVENVSASYSTYRALFGVSLLVPDNGIVALVGSNGAGKSTLARVVSGLVPTSGGRICVAGEDVTRWPAYRISRLGLAHVPEGRAIFSTLSVEENLMVSFSRRIGRKATPEALSRAYEAFPVLAERRKQLGGTLSGGQQRILSLAKVLAVPPKVLVVDELSLGLAPVIVDQVYDGLIAIHKQGCALLVVEQQVDRVLAIADRAVLLVKGAVAWEGPARDARSTLEAHMLGGAAANGSAPMSTNGTHPAPRGVPVPVSPVGATSVPPRAPRPVPTDTPGSAARGGPSGGATHPPDLWVGTELPQHELIESEAATMGLLDGRVAVVTGAGGGIGREIALCLAAEGGARVVVNDLGTTLDGAGTAQGPAAETCALIEKAGGEAVPNGESVADYDGAGRIVAQAVDSFGSIDILVNNAGIVRDRTLVKMTSEDYDAVIAVHQKGTFNCTRHAAVHMREAGYGRIVNITSSAGLRGNFGQSNYGAAKAAIMGMTFVWALELGKYGITANAVAPAGLTRMTENLFGGADAPPDQDPALDAPLVAFLASEQAGYVNGQVLGRTGYAYTIFQTPRQVAAMWREGGWTPSQLAEHFHEVLGQHLQPVGMPAHPLLGKKDGD